MKILTRRNRNLAALARRMAVVVALTTACSMLPMSPARAGAGASGADQRMQDQRHRASDRYDERRPSYDRSNRYAQRDRRPQRRRYPVYVPAPVYYPQHQSPGIRLVFPIDIH
jgi:hypothetical protein